MKKLIIKEKIAIIVLLRNIKEAIFMEKKQKINCTVGSCRYNDVGRQECKLEQIIVTPVVGCDTKQADESMCSSYKCENN